MIDRLYRGEIVDPQSEPVSEEQSYWAGKGHGCGAKCCDRILFTRGTKKLTVNHPEVLDNRDD